MRRLRYNQHEPRGSSRVVLTLHIALSVPGEPSHFRTLVSQSCFNTSTPTCFSAALSILPPLSTLPRVQSIEIHTNVCCRTAPESDGCFQRRYAPTRPTLLDSTTSEANDHHPTLHPLHSFLHVPLGSYFHKDSGCSHLEDNHPLLGRTAMHGRHWRRLLLQDLDKSNSLCRRLQEEIH